ncbi:hypothetical protein B484DRAFT_406794 [Ochromonadaceae sp. CCMP2298]|nr:hypothetical protein B484DRAFT_406794 [Ochromonadaceae sp. CCMP2298]
MMLSAEGPEIEGWDADAFELLTQIPGLALRPLNTMLSHGKAVREQLEHFNSLQYDLTTQLKAATGECDTLKMSALIDKRIAAVTAARVQDTPGSGGFALHSNFGAPGPEGPTSALSAASATSSTLVTFVQIQGHTKLLADPLTSHMARAFRTWALGEQREGRSVHLPALATPKTITGRFRLLSEQKGFCPEFPEGVSSDINKTALKTLAANPVTWWLSWPLPTFLDALICAFPNERAGAYSTTKTLEELLGDITLAVNVSDFTPLSKYRGAVHEACELASPREERNETACVGEQLRPCEVLLAFKREELTKIQAKNPGKRFEVDHRASASKHNNVPTNLDWVTRSENMRRSFYGLDFDEDDEEEAEEV